MGEVQPKGPERLTRTQRRGLAIWQKAGLIVTAGIVVGALTLYIANRSYRNAMYTRANSMAVALDERKIGSLLLPGDSTTQANYGELKQKLIALKQDNRDLHFVYLMGRDQNGSVYFLADSEQPGSDGFSPRGEAYPEASQALHDSFENGRTFIEGPSTDSYGSWLSALAPIRDSGGMVIAVVGIDVPASFYIAFLAITGGAPVLVAGLIAGLVWVTDLNRRKHRENMQFRAEMVSIASHELRTPLTGLRWSEERLLSDAKLARPQHDAIQVMYESTLQLQESIEDVLQLANLDSSKARQLHQTPTDMLGLLKTILVTQQLAAKRRNITIEHVGRWPKDLELNVDAMRIKRVFNNLISNAIKYSREDSVVELIYKHSKGQHIIGVADHGLGIPLAEQAQVFEGFYRASNVTSREIAGTGMGLYVSRAIVEQHGGKLWLTSRENKGTTVYVQLP